VADNGGTSVTVDLVDSADVDASGNYTGTVLASAVDGKALGRTAITVPNGYSTSETSYGIIRTEGGTASSAGTFSVDISYILVGGSDCTQG
jgi:hypothetical protein